MPELEMLVTQDAVVAAVEGERVAVADQEIQEIREILVEDLVVVVDFLEILVVLEVVELQELLIQEVLVELEILELLETLEHLLLL